MATSQNTYAALLALSILLSASAIAFSSYTLWSKPSNSSSQQASAQESLAVVGTGKASGRFDQLLITVAAQASNSTLLEGLQTIQNRIAAASRLFASAGLNVEASSGQFSTVGNTFTSTGTSSQLTVQESVMFTVSNITSSNSDNMTQEAIGIVQESGLANLPQGSYSSNIITTTYQFSPSLENRLYLQAYNGAIQNATKDANTIAASQGLKVTGVLQISETAPAASTAPLSSLLSLYSLLGLAYPSQAVQVSVQVTFAVQSA